MWIYINDLGQVTTNIPHGQIIRQGSSFSIYIAFEKNHFNHIIEEYTGNTNHLIWEDRELIRWLTYYVAVQIKFDDTPIQMPIPKMVTFEKIKENENIGALKDKEKYIVFKYKGLPTYSQEFGIKNLAIRFATVTTQLSDEEDRQWDENIEEHKVWVNGVVQVYVEPTYGYTSQISEITFDQVDFLLEAVNERLRPILEELDLKLNIIDEKVWLLEGTNSPDNVEFARACLEEKYYLGTDKIFFGLIEDNPSIGMLDKSDGIIIIKSDGTITRLVANDNEDASIKIDTSLKVKNKDILTELELKLNKADEKVYLLEEEKTQDAFGFAKQCRDKKSELGTDKIYFGYIASNPVIGITDGNDDTTIITSNGEIFKIDIEGRECPITLSVPTPTQSSSELEAANKKYVDDEIKKVKDGTGSALTSFICYVEDEEEEE